LRGPQPRANQIKPQKNRTFKSFFPLTQFLKLRFAIDIIPYVLRHLLRSFVSDTRAMWLESSALAPHI
jgi:hypothetical protein